jgi:hypothetical protein
MTHEVHQQQLWIKISQIVNAQPGKHWDADALAVELGIEIGSAGYERILEVLQQENLKQEQARQMQELEQQKKPVGFA